MKICFVVVWFRRLCYVSLDYLMVLALQLLGHSHLLIPDINMSSALPALQSQHTFELYTRVCVCLCVCKCVGARESA